MIHPALLQHCRELANLVAPEIRRLYLVPRPADYIAPSNCGAYATFTPDIVIRDYLIARGEWQGPAATIVFLHDYDQCVEWASGVLLHELGHVLPYPEQLPGDEEPTAEERHLHSVFRLAWASPVKPLPKTGFRDAQHDWRFVRRVLHLHFRAQAAGAYIPLPMLGICGWEYGIAPARRYCSALNDEPERLLQATFAEIEATAPPSAFIQLWDSDTRDQPT
jgi:hypothetical protein